MGGLWHSTPRLMFRLLALAVLAAAVSGQTCLPLPDTTYTVRLTNAVADARALAPPGWALPADLDTTLRGAVSIYGEGHLVTSVAGSPLSAVAPLFDTIMNGTLAPLQTYTPVARGFIHLLNPGLRPGGIATFQVTVSGTASAVGVFAWCPGIAGLVFAGEFDACDPGQAGAPASWRAAAHTPIELTAYVVADVYNHTAGGTLLAPGAAVSFSPVLGEARILPANATSTSLVRAVISHNATAGGPTTTASTTSDPTASAAPPGGTAASPAACTAASWVGVGVLIALSAWGTL